MTGGATVRYRSAGFDSARWESLSLRSGDIIISTPPKCGTTWTQMICALLIFQRTTFDRPLDQISPWLDMQLRDIGEVVADLAAQQHRRVIKTHTPLDGLPYDTDVSYICVGRDPRDVAISQSHHEDNTDLAAFLSARERAVGLDDLAAMYPDGAPPQGPTDALGRFWSWVNGATPTTRAESNLATTMHHFATFWPVRDEPNVIMVHYSDLQRDLDGEMRRIAQRLNITVPDDRFSELVAAARFDAMRERADELAPDSTHAIWQDNRQFFHTGRNGQWQTLLDTEGQRRYARHVTTLAPYDVVVWAHGGPLDSSMPD